MAAGTPSKGSTTPLVNVTVAQLLLRYLALEGVDRMFGIPGAAVMHLLNELKNQRGQFQYVICRQETGAVFMADCYSRVSGKLGVVVVTSGPGATNAVTGSMNALNSGVPLLTLTGEVAEQYFGMGYLQEGTDASLNVDAIYANSDAYSALVSNASNFQTLFAQALRDALSLPHHASHISLPDDVAGTALANVHVPNAPSNYRATTSAIDRRGVQAAFERLLETERPLLFLGSGARDALRGPRLEMLETIVEKFAIPVMTTPDGKGIFPESHALSLRNFGTCFCEWTKYYMSPVLLDPSMRRDYDALLVLGTTLGGLATNKWDPILLPKQSLVQVDIDASVIGKVLPLDFGVVSEIGAVFDELFALAMSIEPDANVEPRRQFITQIKQTKSPFLDPANRQSTASPILPQTMMRILSETLPAGSEIFVDAGNCVGWSLHHLTVNPPTRIHSALSMGPMGFAVAGVVGGKMAAPDTTCIAIVGDGAFMMHGTEVSTAAANKVGAIWLVLNDNDLGMVSQGMNQFFPDSSGVWTDYYALGQPDLAQMAKSLGADAYDVRSPDDMQHALAAALTASSLQNKPQVIVAHIDTTQVPPYYQNPGFTPPTPMPNTPIDPPNWPKPIGPFNQGVKAGNTIYVSGQGPIDPATGEFKLGTFEEQARLTFQNVQAVLAAGGATLTDVTKVDVHLSDLSDFAKLNAVYQEFFTSNFPARTTVGSELLMHIAIEVDCVAVIPS